MGCPLSHLVGGLSSDGEERIDGDGGGQIVEGDDRYILWHSYPSIAQRAHDADGDEVVSRKDGGCLWLCAQNFLGEFVAALLRIFAPIDLMSVAQSCLFKRLERTDHPVVGGRMVLPPGDDGDLTVPK